MAKRRRAVKARTGKRRKRRIKPAVTTELASRQAGLVELPAEPSADFRGGSLEAQAALLGGPRLQRAQRRALAAEIGRVQGNRHLQRVIASVKGDEKTALYQSNTPTKSLAGLASGTVMKKSVNGPHLGVTRRADITEAVQEQVQVRGSVGSGMIQLSPLSLELEQVWSTQGKGAFFDRLRNLGVRDQDVADFIERTLEGDDRWLARNLLNYGPEANWPIHLQVEREMKGWADCGGIAEVLNILPQANATEQKHILANSELMGQLRDNANQDEFLQIMLLLVDVTGLPVGPIQEATALLAGSEYEVDRNTAQRLLDGDVTAYYIEDLSQPPNVNDLVDGYGFDSTLYTIYLEPPDNTSHMIIQRNASGFRRQGTSKIFGLRTLSLSKWQTLLAHETNHALNPDATISVELYKSEFRAYWVVEYRGIADLDQRAREIKAHILENYPSIKAAYDSNKITKWAIDAHTRPEGNVTNI